jgi:hypothetical protein
VGHLAPQWTESQSADPFTLGPQRIG